MILTPSRERKQEEERNTSLFGLFYLCVPITIVLQLQILLNKHSQNSEFQFQNFLK